MKKSLIASVALAAAITTAPAQAQTAYKVLRLDPNNLLDQVWAYREIYQKSLVTDLQWTGSTAGCTAGSVSVAAQLKTLQAVNYFRQMAGLQGEEAFTGSAIVPQMGALLIAAQNGLAYDSSGQSSTTSNYACGSAVSPTVLTGRGMAYAGSNLAAVAAAVSENGEQMSNTQQRNRWDLFRKGTSPHFIGLANGVGGVALTTLTNDNDTGSSLFFPPSAQWNYPRSGYFPAALLPTRFAAVGYMRGTGFNFSATLNGAALDKRQNASDALTLDNQWFVGGRIVSTIPAPTGTQTSNLTATFSGLTLNGPGGAQTSTTTALTVFDPAGYDDLVIEPGWYWDQSDGGNGVAIEQAGDRAYVAAYTYRADGSPVWYTGFCNVANKTCSGNLKEYAGGKNVVGQGGQAGEVGNVSPFALSWTNKTTATMSYVGGTLNLSRFKPSGGTDADSVPQTGWWWERDGTGGEGWFIEVSNNYMFVANYSYSGGAATWYIASANMSGDRLRLENAPLMLCSGGRTIYQAPGTKQLPVDGCQQVGTVSMSFNGTDHASVQVASGGESKTNNLRRYYLNSASAR